MLPATSFPDLRDLMQDELVKLVKQVVHGPDTWSPQHSGFTPRVSKEITIHPHIVNVHGILSLENEAKLLPSGQHVLFNNQNKLECWDVAEDRLIWRHAPAVADARVLQFVAESKGSGLVIVICERTFPTTGDQMKYVDSGMHAGNAS